MVRSLTLSSIFQVFACADIYCLRPHPEAKEVYVTGTFDDWGRTEKLNKVGDTFEKEVYLSDASQKILYKVGERPSVLCRVTADGFCIVRCR